jgi:hypothetical protein
MPDGEQRDPFSLVFGQRDVHTVAVMIEAQASRLLGRGCVRAISVTGRTGNVGGGDGWTL